MMEVIVVQIQKTTIRIDSRDINRSQPRLKTTNPISVGIATSSATGMVEAAPQAYHCGLANEMIVHKITPKNGRKKHTGTQGKRKANRMMARIPTYETPPR